MKQVLILLMSVLLGLQASAQVTCQATCAAMKKQERSKLNQVFKAKHLVGTALIPAQVGSALLKQCEGIVKNKGFVRLVNSYQAYKPRPNDYGTYGDVEIIGDEVLEGKLVTDVVFTSKDNLACRPATALEQKLYAINSYVQKVVETMRDDDNFPDCKARNKAERFFSSDCSRYISQGKDGLEALFYDLSDSQNGKKVMLRKTKDRFSDLDSMLSRVDGQRFEFQDAIYNVLERNYQLVSNAYTYALHESYFASFDHEKRDLAGKIHWRLVKLAQELSSEIAPLDKVPDLDTSHDVSTSSSSTIFIPVPIPSSGQNPPIYVPMPLPGY